MPSSVVGFREHEPAYLELLRAHVDKPGLFCATFSQRRRGDDEARDVVPRHESLWRQSDQDIERFWILATPIRKVPTPSTRPSPARLAPAPRRMTCVIPIPRAASPKAHQSATLADMPDSKSPQKKKRRARKTPPEATTAMVVHGSEHLTRDDRTVLAEALRQAEGTRNIVEAALLDFGRWLLVEVFHDDAAAALGAKGDNSVWRELVDRAGGPTLRLGERFLFVALEIAAHDKRIQDDAWRLLESGRKELLLPLKDETLMRKAAQHVVTMKLSQRATREYVRAELVAQGGAEAPRVTTKRFQAHVRRFRERVLDAAYRRKMERSLRELPKEEKAGVRGELLAIKTWAAELLATMR